MAILLRRPWSALPSALDCLSVRHWVSAWETDPWSAPQWMKALQVLSFIFSSFLFLNMYFSICVCAYTRVCTFAHTCRSQEKVLSASLCHFPLRLEVFPQRLPFFLVRPETSRIQQFTCSCPHRAEVNTITHVHIHVRRRDQKGWAWIMSSGSC